MMTSNNDLKKMADFLDTRFRLPGGIRIGWDGIIGFIPGIGDFITNLMSIYIIIRAAMLGCSPLILVRMGLNVLLDNLFDLVPVFGNFFDLFWRSNTKNLALLESYYQDPANAERSSRWAVGLTVTLVVTVLIASVILIGMMAIWAFHQLQALSQNNWTI